MWQWARSVAGRARQPGSRRRLVLAVVIGDEELARAIVRMLVRLAERQDGRDAGIGAIERCAPLVAGPGRKYLGETRGGRGPRRLVQLRRQRRGIQPETLHQCSIELRLDGADGHVLAILRAVRVVEGRAAVEHVGA